MPPYTTKMRAASPATLLWLRSTLESPALSAPRNLSSACRRASAAAAASSSSSSASPLSSCSSAATPPPSPLSSLQRNPTYRSARPRYYTTGNSSAKGSSPRQQEQKHNLREEPLRRTNFYDLFPESIPSGPPPKGPFTIDLRQLRREFLKLQAQAHPDLAAEDEKAAAQARSARINEAYRTLQHPLWRAQYLLSLRGVDVSGDETAKVEDEELLMEVMEVREEIESAESEEEVEELRKINEKRIDACVQGLEKAFAEEDVEKAKKECVKLRYWINVRDTLHAWEKGKRVEIIH